MKLRITARAFCLLLFLVLNPGTTNSQLGPAAAIGGVLNGLRQIAEELTKSAAELLEQGNAALAQQQMLLGGLIEASISHIEKSYSNSLNKTFDELNMTERTVYEDAKVLLDQVNNLQRDSANSIYEAIYKVQGAANQILDRLPLIDRYPVYYGFRVNTKRLAFSENPADLEIFGFSLVDERRNYMPPIVRINDEVIPVENLTIEQDRIAVQIPSNIKRTIQFEDVPCQPVKSFRLDLEVFYVEEGRILWIIPNDTKKTVRFGGRGIAMNPQFSATVAYWGKRNSKEIKTEEFSIESGEIRFGCEDRKSTTTSFTAPEENAVILVCNAAWTSTHNTQGASANGATSGRVCTGSGTIHGQKKRGIKSGLLTIQDCPGGGWSKLRVFGKYQYEVPKTIDFRQEARPAAGTFNKSSSLMISVSQDENLKVEGIEIGIYPKACPTQLDLLKFENLPDGGPDIRNASEEGLFIGTYRAGLLRVEAQ